jgi:hypothetical protein
MKPGEPVSAVVRTTEVDRQTKTESTSNNGKFVAVALPKTAALGAQARFVIAIAR